MAGVAEHVYLQPTHATNTGFTHHRVYWRRRHLNNCGIAAEATRGQCEYRRGWCDIDGHRAEFVSQSDQTICSPSSICASINTLGCGLGCGTVRGIGIKPEARDDLGWGRVEQLALGMDPLVVDRLEATSDPCSPKAHQRRYRRFVHSLLKFSYLLRRHRGAREVRSNWEEGQNWFQGG